MTRQKLFLCIFTQCLAHYFEPAIGADFTSQLIAGTPLSAASAPALGNQDPSASVSQGKSDPASKQESANTPVINSAQTQPQSAEALKDSSTQSTGTGSDKGTAVLPVVGVGHSAATSEVNLSHNPADSSSKTSDQNIQKALSPSASTSDVWDQVPVILGVLAFFGLCGLLAVRLKRDGILKLSKHKKKMEILETLSLGPKRHLFLVEVRGQSLLLGSTESSLNLVKDFSTEQIPENAFESKKTPAQPGLFAGLTTAQTHSVAQRIAAKLEHFGTSDEAPQHNTQVLSGSTDSTQPTPNKQAMLANALGALKKKGLTNPATQPAEVPKNETPALRAATVSAPNAGSFPKYLANAFAQESKRISPQRNDGSNATQDDPQLESVTNLIRAKLKEMKPLT